MTPSGTRSRGSWLTSQQRKTGADVDTIQSENEAEEEQPPSCKRSRMTPLEELFAEEEAEDIVSQQSSMSIKKRVERELQMRHHVWGPCCMLVEPTRLILCCLILLFHIYACKRHLLPVNVCSPLQETPSVQNHHAYWLRRPIWSFFSTKTVSSFFTVAADNPDRVDASWSLLFVLMFCTRLVHQWEHSYMFKYLLQHQTLRMCGNVF